MIPARNEAPRLGLVLEGLARWLPEATVLVVDDGSEDETASIARAAGASVLSTGGVGYAAALAAGHAWLLDAGLGPVIQLDADGQHPPASAPALIAALQHADLVWGVRVGVAGPLPRRLGGAILSLAVAAAGVRDIYGGRLRDVTSGFLALSVDGQRRLARDWPGGTCDANLRVRAARAGLRLMEVPVPMAPRSGGVSMHDGPAAALHLASSLRAVAQEARRI